MEINDRDSTDSLIHYIYPKMEKIIAFLGLPFRNTRIHIFRIFHILRKQYC